MTTIDTAWPQRVLATTHERARGYSPQELSFQLSWAEECLRRAQGYPGQPFYKENLDVLWDEHARRQG